MRKHRFSVECMEGLKRKSPPPAQKMQNTQIQDIHGKKEGLRERERERERERKRERTREADMHCSAEVTLMGAGIVLTSSNQLL